jgi:hypothetical protein
MALPTEKRAPQPGIGKLWIHGAPKIGKSTTAAEMDPDNAVIEDTEGSTTAIQGFIVDVRSWEEFRQYNRELAEDAAKGDERLFTTAIVDTVDVLAQLCSDSVLRGLAGLQPGQEQYLHASDFEYGKGWDAVTKEFSLRVAQLCAVVPNVVFISHAKETTIKTRAGGERTLWQPALAPKGVSQFLEGFVDRIIFAELVPQKEGEDVRLLRTQPSPDYMAGGRNVRGGAQLADPLPMDGRRLRAALEALSAPSAPAKAPAKRPGKAAAAAG